MFFCTPDLPNCISSSYLSLSNVFAFRLCFALILKIVESAAEIDLTKVGLSIVPSIVLLAQLYLAAIGRLLEVAWCLFRI